MIWYGSTTHNVNLVVRGSSSRTGKIDEVMSAVTYRHDIPRRKGAGKVIHVDGNGNYMWGKRNDSATDCSDNDSAIGGDGDSNSDSDTGGDGDSDSNSDSDTADEELVTQDYHSANGSNMGKSDEERE